MNDNWFFFSCCPQNVLNPHWFTRNQTYRCIIVFYWYDKYCDKSHIVFYLNFCLFSRCTLEFLGEKYNKAVNVTNNQLNLPILFPYFLQVAVGCRATGYSAFFDRCLTDILLEEKQQGLCPIKLHVLDFTCCYCAWRPTKWNKTTFAFTGMLPSVDQS